MKGQDLFKAIGTVSEQHIKDTFVYFRMRKRMKFIKIGSVAAALGLVITGTVLTALHGMPGREIQDPGSQPVWVEENGFLIRDGELIKYTGSETDVVIPETVDAIADNAFADAKNINTVMLTANVKQVGYDAFNGEKGFRLLLSADNRYFTDTGDSIISTDGDNLLQYIGGERDSYQIPDGVKQISAFAFYEAKINEIIFPDGLEYIGKGAFSGCSMRAIYLPDSIEYVGVQAFSQCINAVDGTVPQTAEIGKDAFFRVPFYMSIIAGHPCPGEDIQRGTVKPSEVFVKSAHLQEINDAVLEFIQTGYMSNFYVERSELYFPDLPIKVDMKNAVFVEGAWGDQIECRANIYVTDQQYVSIGLVCTNPYDCTEWNDVEWRICRAEFYPEMYETQKDGLSLTFRRDAETLNYMLQEIGYDGSIYEAEIDWAVLSPGGCGNSLQKITDGLYVIRWNAYENRFDQNFVNYNNTSRGPTDHEVLRVLTAIDLRSGNLHLTHYLNEIDGHSFRVTYERMNNDGQYKLLLEDYGYLLIDWVEYLANGSGITLYEFKTDSVNDVADIGKLYTGDSYGFMPGDFELDALRAFIAKDTAALEEYAGVPSGTYDLYKTLEFGEYTISRIFSDPEADMYYNGNAVIFFDVEVIKSDVPGISTGKHCFAVESGIGGTFVKEKDRISYFTYANPDLWEMDQFVSLLRRSDLLSSMAIPDIDALTEEELREYKERVIVYIIDFKSKDGVIKFDDVIAYANKLFGLTVTQEDIRNVNMYSYSIEGDRIYVGGHGGSTTGIDIIERIDWGDTITVVARFYAEGSYTIPAKDIRYTLTRTPDGLAFLTPSEMIQDYDRPVWGFTV